MVVVVAGCLAAGIVGPADAVHAVTTPPGVQVAASEARPSALAVFNVPVNPLYNNHNENQALQEAIIQDATVGSTLQMNMYQLADIAMARSLVRAAGRGVHVQVLLDGNDARIYCEGRAKSCVNAAYLSLESLNTINATDPRTWLKTCAGIGPAHPTVPAGKGNGCIGQQEDHDKFLLASNTLWDGHDVPVVLQSSSNDIRDNYNRGFNDTLVLGDQPQVLANYQRYFARLAAVYNSTANSSRLWFTPASGDTRDTTSHDIATWSFPQPIATDPVVRMLDGISTADRCRNTTGTGPGPARTHVDIAMFHLIGRPAITERLAALSRAGCVVSVVYAQIGTGNLRALTKAHVGLQQLCAGSYIGTTDPSAYVHSKYLLVQGNYHGIGSNRRIVFTGSENWTKENLIKSDNRIIRYAEPASNSPIFTAYLNNFRLLRKTGAAARPTASDCAAAND